jgi:hypothetical protein
MPAEIANADLTEHDVPSSKADWHQIGKFALSFDGYSHWGSFGECAEIGNRWAKAYAEGQTLPDSLTDLRTCLFFEQRRWRHYGWDPDEEAMHYIRALVEAIRRKVAVGEVS